eukprot:g2228.t1
MMVFRNLVAIAALSCTLLLDQTTNAEAAFCVVPFSSVCDMTTAAVIARVNVDIGTLVSSSTAESGDDNTEDITVTATVKEVYKGMVTVDSKLTFTTSATNGVDLIIGGSYVISLFYDSVGDLYASPCGLATQIFSTTEGTEALEALEADLETCNFDGGAEYVGCFSDDEEDRVLVEAFSSDTMTNMLCIDYCADEGYKAAATQWGEQCWCHNDSTIGETYFSRHTTDDASCTKDCEGAEDNDVSSRGDGVMETAK